MQQHVKIVAILNIVLSGLGILGSLFVLLMFGGLAGIVNTDQSSDSAAVATFLGAIGGIAFVAIIAICVPTLIAGIGLLKFREWARILTIVMSVLNMINIPLGTAVGFYGVWVLTRDETLSLFKRRDFGDPLVSAH